METKSNKNLTNNEVKAQFAELLKNDQVIVLDVQPSKNPDQIAVFLAQSRKVDSRSAGTMSAIQEKLLGFDKQLIRSVQQVAKPIAAQLKLEPGMVFPVPGLALQVVDQVTPFYEGQEPITVNDKVKTSGGKAIYTQSSLVEKKDLKDTILKYDVVVESTEDESTEFSTSLFSTSKEATPINF